VTRDRHGHKHTVFKQITVQDEPVSAIHKVSKRVAVMVKDRRGHLHRVFRTQLVDVADEPLHHGYAGAATSRHSASNARGGHLANSEEQNDDDSASKSKKASRDDGEPKSDGVEPERNNPSYGKAYALYDEGANARISGNYALAITNLGRALATVPANSHGGPSVLQLNMEYDLAQAAEAQGDMALAARYYARALSDRPNFTEAAVRLATVLARAGNYGDATRAARAAVLRSPNDPRTHAILSVILEKSGSVEEAKIERQKTRALMANIHSLDTAPLVSPDVVSPANPQDSDKTTANDKESDMQRSPEKAPESDVMSGDTDSVPARR
jgi:Flp pilus assembly protein TadD